METGLRIPIFPLNAVLFPYAVLPLHIFEPRYLKMVDHCLETGEGFGVALLREGTEIDPEASPHSIGTLARITNLQRLDDGRLYLTAIGVERFHICDFDREEAYLQAGVEPWRERPWQHDNDAYMLMEEVTLAFEGHLRSMLEQEGLAMRRIEFPEDPVLLSFAVASSLPSDLGLKQRLLETRDTSERLRLLLDELREISRQPRIKSFDPDRHAEMFTSN